MALTYASRPVRARGLKLKPEAHSLGALWSRPVRARGLKQACNGRWLRTKKGRAPCGRVG